MLPTARLKLTDINEILTCSMCGGYLIDATTIVECLHSFCKACIVRYIEVSGHSCPVCEAPLHKTKPHVSLHEDKTLQDIVYKLIPGLYKNEMQRRREFFAKEPEAALKVSCEGRGEGAGQRCFYSPEEKISLTLEYLDGTNSAEIIEGVRSIKLPDGVKDVTTRYLNCPAAISVENLKKFLRCKFELQSDMNIKIMYSSHCLSDHYTLVDIAYIYSWKRAGPMKLHYAFVPLKLLPKKTFKTCVKATEPSCTSSSSALKVEMAEATSSAKLDVPLPDDSSDTSEKALESRDESEKMDTEESVTVASSSESSRTSLPEDVLSSDTSRSTPSSTSDTQLTDVDKVSILSGSLDCASSVDIPLQPTTLKVVPAPDSAGRSAPGALKLKLVQCPQPVLKQNSKKRGGRRPRYKSQPVQRFPRLAPYPPPPGTPIANAGILPQITMGKLMTTIAPNLVTALVSSTVNTPCNATKSSMVLPAPSYRTKPATVASHEVCRTPETFTAVTSAVPESGIPTVSSTSTALTASPFSTYLNGLPTAHVLTIPKVNSPTFVQACNGAPTTPSSSQSNSVAVDSVIIAETPKETPASVFIESSKSVSDPLKSISDSSQVNETPAKDINKLPIASVTQSCTNIAAESSEAQSSTEKIQPSSSELNNDAKSRPSECNGVSTSPPLGDSVFHESFMNKKDSESFKLSVKNSISAEFSDNDDLGCPPDLVVDEQKMDSSDNEEDADLRKKITAIAEKEDEDTEADSGRASGVSNQDRSSCDDDVGSPMDVDVAPASAAPSPLTNGVTTTTSAPSTPTSETAVNPRNVKSNNINHVINNLLRHHEKKDSMGALDLSTCLKKPTEVSNRVKPVANPVLDIKHRQQAYLPAPSNAPPAKQHTACAPAPKPPSSSPILFHGLTSGLHRLLTPPAPVHRKSPHLPVPAFQHVPMPYPSQSKVSATTPSSGRIPSGNFTPRTLSPPSIMPNIFTGMMATGMFPRSTNPGAMSPRLASTLKPISSPTPSLFNKMGNNSYKSDKNRKSEVKSSPNNRNSAMSSSNVTAQASYPKSPSAARMSPHHKSASPAPIPKSPSSTAGSSSYKPSIPIYKKSSDTFKNYNSKFKSSSNLAVINPDPNGYRQKIVIRNMDVRPNNPQSQRL